MKFYERLERETKGAQEKLLSHPFIRAGLAGTLSLESYRAFLAQAFYHVRHTAALMMSAGVRFTDELQPLQKAMAEYIEEEIGHDEWILNDIEQCGGDRESVRKGQPELPCELMVAFTYDVANRRNPLGIFGMVFVLEGTSIKAATPAAEALQKGLDLPANAFRYLTTHGSLDLEHFEFFKGLMNDIKRKDDQDWIIHCAQVIFGLYTEMFDRLPLTYNAHACSTLQRAQVSGI